MKWPFVRRAKYEHALKAVELLVGALDAEIERKAELCAGEVRYVEPPLVIVRNATWRNICS